MGPFVFYRRRLASAAANACVHEMRAHFATRRLERTVASVSFDIVRVVHSCRLIHARIRTETEFARASIHHEGGAHQGAVETPQDEAEKGEREAISYFKRNENRYSVFC